MSMRVLYIVMLFGIMIAATDGGRLNMPFDLACTS